MRVDGILAFLSSACVRSVARSTAPNPVVPAERASNADIPLEGGQGVATRAQMADRLKPCAGPTGAMELTESFDRKGLG